ncbi:alpha/beta hydrolase family protein [Labrys sp. KB_33_2]|uniref:alpha/beta hydrolase family protein n=1 Tax=Labrys sp. KB_33_2 TaxID=3237479 RepID=UPI003F934D8A
MRPPVPLRLRLLLFAFLPLLCLLAPAGSRAAGLSLIEIPADGGRPALTGGVWYPCAGGTPTANRFGPIVVEVVRDCPPAGMQMPLVVISHGVGGSFVSHRDTARALADAGFIVAAVDHPLNSGRSATRRPGDIASMLERPDDIKRLVDFMLAGWPGAARIAPERIGVFGFSRGGYTGLAAIGGTPDFRLILGHCPTYPGNRWCAQIEVDATDGRALTHDARIKAAVIADPAFGAQFTVAGLRPVTVPVQLWASEFGGDGVGPKDADTVAHNLTARPELHVAAKAGHFAFLAPCSAELAKAAADFGEAEICTDGADFDRIAFHRNFNAEVLRFFRRHLGAGQGP